ncbi:unnamed protein product [Penicillium olsonii]|nr:unnamed protein product [Penicillium olsonii]CAG7917106.1 unnamed protein product [Penicillium olsonii]
MHKISNFTGQARHGWERMTPTFGMSRPHTDMAFRRPHGAPPMTPPTSIDPTVNLSFNVPFSSTLAGPDVEDVLHASPGAVQRWTFPEGTPEGTSVHQLPVHTNNVEGLQRLCRKITEEKGGRVEATLTTSEAKAVPSLQRRPNGLVTNVCVTGDGEMARKMRAKILNETPIMLRCATVDVDMHLIMDASPKGIRASVLEHLDTLAAYTGADIFLLTPKLHDADSAVVSSYGYASDNGLDQRFRVAIYGDLESSEHAKTRVLIMIDQIVSLDAKVGELHKLTRKQLKRHVDAIKLDSTMHTLVCGRTRKNIKLIEAATGTAIYFPPPFPQIFGYIPPGANRRSEDEVYITGETPEQIARAKQKLRELVMGVKIFVKDVVVSSSKIDNILLDRLDKVRKVMEMNGSYVLFPQLGSQRGLVRIQGTEVLHVERTVREIMALAGQFYSASWWIIMPDPAQGGLRAPSTTDIRSMLSDICTNSEAEVSFDNLTFTINGSDDAVKAAMTVINQIPFVMRSQYQMRVKIELANEHKEFVSGKKNGKINKIMGQSNVQIIFDGFNEYNFYIDVCGNQYESTKNGLDLVEQEMPASISFHVPDQYHKRIIGIGGQHIQRIMKKYSVFVKFSNAMDRGGMGKEDDDIKVDNVICRTPARNAQSLDLVKQEIMDMVEKVDAEYVSERVVINRLYHRELLARMTEIDELEKKWNCKIEFPSTELASDVVTISGPEYQVPQAVDALLGMVPESHELHFQSSVELQDYFKCSDFLADVRTKLKEQYEVDINVDVGTDLPTTAEEGSGSSSPTPGPEDRVVLGYTRNNAGGLKDAIDFLISRLVAHGLDANTVKGAIPRPKSDSFEESLPFFDSKLLQHAPAPLSTDSPTRPNFSDETSERGSIFERLRKPGSISSFSSFIGRKNHSASPGSFFKHASSNASKASLVSMESRDSGYRNPWNDSGVNLPEDDMPVLGSSHSHKSSNSNGWPTRFDAKFPFGTAPGDMTPKHDPRTSFDSGRPSTSNSTSGYPAPIGPPPTPYTSYLFTMDYPRPDFQRTSLNWSSLDGPWTFTFDDKDEGLTSQWQKNSLSAPSQTITVPYAFQTPASGINLIEAHEVLWYERHITDIRTPSEKANGNKLILRFGAVDYECSIWIDGVCVGGHVGGHVPFDIDVSDALHAKTEARLTLRVRDSPYDMTQPRGKQFWGPVPESIFYTPSGGIWLSVWLESVPATRILCGSGGTVLRADDIDGGKLRAKVAVAGRRVGSVAKVEIEAALGGLNIGKAAGDIPKDKEFVSVELGMKASDAAQSELKKNGGVFGVDGVWHGGVAVWAPEHPVLYDLTLRLFDGSGKLLDEIQTTAGMRSLSWQSGDGTFRLNGKPYFQMLFLDQGYWPETGLTPPSSESLKTDIELAKKVGFNGCRKHQKVEDSRFFYWADRLGFLVWGEMANAYEFGDQYIQRFTAEWTQAVKRDINHASVVTWTPINESWAVPALEDNIEQRNHIRALYYLTKNLDPSRPVNDNCGWQHIKTDLTTFHDYSDSAELAKTCSTMSGILGPKGDHKERSMFPKPICSGAVVLDEGSHHVPGAPVICSEFGGVNIAPPKDSAAAGERDWGYTTASDPADFLVRFEKLVKAVVEPGHICGLVWTQLCDIEQEVNGLYTYDRKEKVQTDKVKAIMDAAKDHYHQHLTADKEMAKKLEEYKVMVHKDLI